MNMQAFYKMLSVKPTQRRQHRLANLTRASRAQVLNATGELTWFIWDADTPNA